MKYSKELNQTLKTINTFDRIFIIHYKKWKKMKNLNKNWKFELLLKILFTPKHLLDINLKTLYKICKRFQKRNLCDDSNFFYIMISKRYYDTFI